MSDIIVNHIGELDPQLASLARPLIARWETAVLRVAAKAADPKIMAFAPSSGTHEAILQKRFSRLNATQKKKASQEAVSALKSSQIQTRLGILGIDFTAPRPIEQLMKKLPSSITKEQLLAAANARFNPLQSTDVVAPLPGSLKSLKLELIRMVCVDETNGFLGSEAGQDEIKLGGAALQETAEIGKIGPVDLGDFDDHGSSRQKDFAPPKVLFKFNLASANTFPNAYFATLVLAEIDHGNFNETVNEIIQKLKAEATEYLAALIGSQVGLTAGPLGALVGLLVGYAVGKVINALVSAWNDDPFVPQTIEVIIPSAHATFDGKLTQASQVIRFTGPGEYAMRYRWALEKVPQPVNA